MECLHHFIGNMCKKCDLGILKSILNIFWSGVCFWRIDLHPAVVKGRSLGVLQEEKKTKKTKTNKQTKTHQNSRKQSSRQNGITHVTYKWYLLFCNNNNKKPINSIICYSCHNFPSLPEKPKTQKCKWKTTLKQVLNLSLLLDGRYFRSHSVKDRYIYEWSKGNKLKIPKYFLLF